MLDNMNAIVKFNAVKLALGNLPMETGLMSRDDRVVVLNGFD